MSSEAMTAALARLELSRGNLRRGLLPTPDPEETHADGTPVAGKRRLSRRLRATWRHWRKTLDFWPVTAIATGVVQGWWQMHPWRVTTELLADEIHDRTYPWIRKHPVATVAAAAAVGASVVAIRPWRWPLVSNQIRPLPARVFRWGMFQLAQAPVQAAIAAMIALITAQNHAEGEPAAAADEGLSSGPASPEAPAPVYAPV